MTVLSIRLFFVEGFFFVLFFFEMCQAQQFVHIFFFFFFFFFFMRETSQLYQFFLSFKRLFFCLQY